MTANGGVAAKIARIHSDEKKLLSRLYEMYANNYKKYKRFIRKNADVPISIKKIYTVLDERKAYRRISDYFHRARTANREKRRRSKRSPRTASDSSVGDHPGTSDASDAMRMDHEMADDQSSTTSSIVAVEIDPKRTKKHTCSQPRPPRQAIEASSDAQSNVPSAPLLSLRTSIQKALDEVNRTITSKGNSTSTIERFCQPLVSRNQWFFNTHRHAKLDDIVRSLSAGVHQPSPEESSLVLDESSRSSTRDCPHQQSNDSDSRRSMRDVLQRLQTLVERGHVISDRLEGILAQV